MAGVVAEGEDGAVTGTLITGIPVMEMPDFPSRVKQGASSQLYAVEDAPTAFEEATTSFAVVEDHVDYDEDSLPSPASAGASTSGRASSRENQGAPLQSCGGAPWVFVKTGISMRRFARGWGFVP